MRISYEELEKIKKQYGVDTIYSYSRVDSYHTSPFCYYLRYIKKEKEQVKDSIYTYSGTAAHDILEKYYEDQIAFNEMLPLFETELETFDLIDLKFNRSDEEKNAKIKTKYNDCLKHFFKNHKKIPGEPIIEQFVLTNINGNIFQGYIDLTTKTVENGEEITTIYDFKTSTKFSSKDMETKTGQLILYAIGLMQRGIDISNIRIAYDFLKYATITFTMKNGKIKHQDVERNQIGAKLATSAKVKLKDAGYNEDEIKTFLEDLVYTNSIDVLPEEIVAQYEIDDCIVYVDLNQEKCDDFTKTMTENLTIIQELDNKTRILLSEGKESEAEQLWWDDDDLLKKNEYYHINLSGFTRAQNKPWDKYCKLKEEKEKHKNDVWWEPNQESNTLDTDDDMDWISGFTGEAPVSNSSTSDEDMSWMEEFN